MFKDVSTCNSFILNTFMILLVVWNSLNYITSVFRTIQLISTVTIIVSTPSLNPSHVCEVGPRNKDSCIVFVF